VLNYLKSDGVVIPKEACVEQSVRSDDDESYYVGSIDWDPVGENDDEITSPTFPEFSKELDNSIREFGGAIFIKMNWSSPSDAAWVATNNSLKCSNLQDIYLLLKSSDKISKDLHSDYKNDNGPKYYLVIKKWKDICPGSEFRCFVSGDELIAISQRSKTEFYDHLLQSKLDIVNDIKHFFLTKIKNKFDLRNYIFDVVRTSSGLVKVLDFGSFNDKDTDTYLFSWTELNDMEYIEGVSPEFRFIAENIGIQPNMSNHFGMPKDLTEFADEGTKRSLIDLLQKQVTAQEKL
jgi:hypothetical protein